VGGALRRDWRSASGCFGAEVWKYGVNDGLGSNGQLPVRFPGLELLGNPTGPGAHESLTD
jgi:hypothetical protein